MAVEGTQAPRCSVREVICKISALHCISCALLAKTEGMDREAAMEERTLCWTEAGRRR